MSETTETAERTERAEPVIPEGAGLKAGGRADSRPSRSSDELLDAAAAGEVLAPAEHDDLVAYYLDNGEMPGDTTGYALEVTLGHGATAKRFACKVRAIEWSEWQDGRQRASDEKTGEINTFVWASWNVARVLLEPKLGPTIQRLQTAAKASEDGKIDGQGGKRVDPPADAAHLLRRMFGRQSGALLELSAKVLELSKLQSDSNSVREIEAAKN
jgi:hypothetical protein